jgi:hypothetical protein
MRTAVATVAILLAPALVAAGPPEKLYYVGEAKLSSAAGQSMGSQVILLEKIHDSDEAKIIERAVVVQPDGKAEEHTMRMDVKGDDRFTLVDDAGTTEGSGILFGPVWKWTYFKATYRASNGVRIEDENFMADPSLITARKKVTGPDDKVIMYMDVSLKEITPKTFEVLRAALIKK